MVNEVNGVRTVTRRLKTRLYGWIVDRSDVYNEYGLVEKWWELCDPDDPDHPIVHAFRWRKAAEAWARIHNA